MAVTVTIHVLYPPYICHFRIIFVCVFNVGCSIEKLSCYYKINHTNYI